jgi:hypothetical protein
MREDENCMSESNPEQKVVPSRPPSPGLAPFWRDVERLVRARLEEADPEDISAHGLGPLAADLLDRDGRPVDPLFARERTLAHMAMLVSGGVLERIRAAASGPLLLLKGPELALRYPNNARRFGDLDVLAADAGEAQRALLAAGFVEDVDPDGIWVGIHHLNPVRLPSLPVKIEIHSEPKWVPDLPAPDNAELFEAAVPTTLGVEGVGTPAPPHHALLVAAHAWGHEPLRRARDLLDAGVFAAEADPCELRTLARAWDLDRLWATTEAAFEALVSGRRTWPLRLWAGHIPELRSQTVLEDHVCRVLSDFWGYPIRIASARAAHAVLDEFRPAFDETWSEKGRRSVLAVRRGLQPAGRHQRLLGDSAARGQRRNKANPPG